MTRRALRARSFGALSLAALTATRAALAAPSWFPAVRDPTLVPSSAEIVEDDELVFQSPNPEAQRRGAARLGARLPVFGWRAASGCQGRWLLVGAFAWLCEDRVRLSDWPALGVTEPAPSSDALPYRYLFVGADGSFGYASLSGAEQDVPTRQFEPGFAVAVAELEPQASTGETFARTSHGLWLPARDLVPANPSAFQGALVTEPGAALGRLAWTLEETPVFDNRDGSLQRTTLSQFSRVEVRELVPSRRGTLAALIPSGFVAAAKLRMPRAHPAPLGLREDERWIAVDLTTQTLVAYQGSEPWFATLVSTGRGREGSTEATPLGEHRIWVKLVSTDMTNLEDEDANSYYAIEDVPWVMFFKDGYGLHGAFWHRSFGNRRSHGCVNLSPRDAERLFHWASPRLPTGFRAVHPTAHDEGTRVVVF